MGRRYLIRGLFMIFQDSGYGAVQNKAQFIKRLCRDGLSAFHAVNRIRRQPMTINEVIGGHILFVQRAPKRLIGNHKANPSVVNLLYRIMLNPLTILKMLTIIYMKG